MELVNNYSDAFLSINFIDRYLKLSSEFRFELKDGYKNFTKDEVIRIIKELGYEANYLKKDDFFRIEQLVSPFKLHFNMTLKSGIVEFIWGVWERNLPILELSGPWGVLADNAGYDTPIRKPIFRNYEDLRFILGNAFSIYEDFKKELQTVNS
jgi:hypothetical protein